MNAAWLRLRPTPQRRRTHYTRAYACTTWWQRMVTYLGVHRDSAAHLSVRRVGARRGAGAKKWRRQSTAKHHTPRRQYIDGQRAFSRVLACFVDTDEVFFQSDSRQRDSWYYSIRSSSIANSSFCGKPHAPVGTIHSPRSFSQQQPSDRPGGWVQYWWGIRTSGRRARSDPC